MTTPADAEIDALVDSVRGICGQVGCGPRLWPALEEIGVTLLPVAERYGGAGADMATMAAVARELGRCTASTPVIETALLAGWLLASCDTPVPSGMLTAAIAPASVAAEYKPGGGLLLTGVLPRLPWGRDAGHLVVLVERGDERYVTQLAPSAGKVLPGTNVAGEPRDTIVLDRVAVSADQIHPVPTGSGVSATAFRARGALGRAMQMAGAAERALELTVRYAGERVQFGRALSRQQAVQHMIAQLAGEAVAMRIAADGAARAADSGEHDHIALAAAKARVSAAAGTVASIAHQVHGAIGFTDEHALQRATTRLWAWRDEYGNEAEWCNDLARRALAAGGRGLWPLITGDV